MSRRAVVSSVGPSASPARERYGWPRQLVVSVAVPAAAILWAAVALAGVIAHSAPFGSRETDAMHYLWQATGGADLFSSQFHGPGFPLATRALWLAGISPFLAGKLVAWLAACTLVAVSWKLLRLVAPVSDARLAWLLSLLSPLLLVYSFTVGNDMLATTLFVSALYLFLSSDASRSRGFVVAGAVGALALLTRSIYAVILVAPAVAILASVATRDWRFVRRSAVFVAGFLLVFLGWTLLRAYAATDAAIEGDEALQQHLILANDLEVYLGQDDGRYPTLEEYPSLGHVLRERSGALPGYLMKSVSSFPARLNDVLPGFAWFALPGLFLWLRSVDRKKAVLVATYASYLAIVLVLHYEERYYLPFLPLVALCAATTIQRISIRMRLAGSFENIGRRRTVALRGVCIGALAAFALLSTVQVLRACRQDEAREYLSAATWLARSTKPDALVVACKPHVSFFSSRQYVMLDQLDEGSLLGLARGHDAETREVYVVYDERFAQARAPWVVGVLSSERLAPRIALEPVFRVEGPKWLSIYRVVAAEHPPAGASS
jgi:hypothetical protein